MLFEICDYDVWGNPRDGFTVNDVYETGLKVELSEEMTDKQIIKELKKIGFLNSYLRYSDWVIEGEFEHGLYINRTTAKLGGLYPVCELWPVDNER